jgi:uncharacterized membrane protein
MSTNASIKRYAWQRVTENYWPVVGVSLIYALLEVIASHIPYIGFLVSIFIGTVVYVGLRAAFLALYRQQGVRRDMLSQPFQRYGRVLGGMLWQALWIILWALLFIVPGIVKGYSYFCTAFILADSPNVPATRALDMSKVMMHGHKARVFVAQLSFIGWALLEIALIIAFDFPILIGTWGFSSPWLMSHPVFTSGPFLSLVGIGDMLSFIGMALALAFEILFFGPYFSATMAGYYEEIKADALQRQVLTPADFEYGYGQQQPPGPQEADAQQQQQPYGPLQADGRQPSDGQQPPQPEPPDPQDPQDS